MIFLTFKGEKSKGYITTIPSLVRFAVMLILNDILYKTESISITKDTIK